MSNAEKYAEVFIKTLGVDEKDLNNLEYQGMTNWDSVGHMNLIATMEEAFDIMFDSDDIIDFSSFTKGKEILSSKYNIVF